MFRRNKVERTRCGFRKM